MLVNIISINYASCQYNNVLSILMVYIQIETVFEEVISQASAVKQQ